MLNRKSKLGNLAIFILLCLSSLPTFAGEADIKIPDLGSVAFNLFGAHVTGMALMYFGLLVCALGVGYGWLQYLQTKNLQVHKSMSDVSQIIWETCKTYLF